MADRARGRSRVAYWQPRKHSAKARAWTLRASVALLIVLLPTALSAAEEPWIYSPYRIQVWFAVENQHELTSFWRKQLDSFFRQQSWVVAGAPWRLRTADAPPHIRSSMLRDLEDISAEQLVASDKKLQETDKLMLVRISSHPSGFSIAAREFDVRTRVFGEVIQFVSGQRELIASEAFRAVTVAFAPIGRIDDVREEIVEKPGEPEVKLRQSVAIVRIRAGGLVTDQTSPAAVKPQQAMLAVIRTNDRRGETRAEGIRTVEWTLLEVRENNDGNAECRVHTANRQYLMGRASSRVERIAVALRITEPSTMLEVVTRDEKKQPLAGYYIYAKDPNTEETELLGQTDWRGQIEVKPAKDGRVRMLYVRSGDSLLARLPMVPGQAKIARAELFDDEKRLQAEALVRGLQSSFVDLVARREILAARLRKRVKEGRVDEAKLLLEEFRALPTLNDMRTRIDQAQQEVTTKNSREQGFIDKMFADTQQLLVKFIDPTLVDNLARDVAEAKPSDAADSATADSATTGGAATSSSTGSGADTTTTPPTTDENPFESPEEKTPPAEDNPFEDPQEKGAG